MDHTDSGVFISVAVHAEVSIGLHDYVDFWHKVYGDKNQSVEIDNWRQLYE